ncbi:MAG TPA: hypothetical protein VNN80_13465, partial [Polyangiaceae bacterium]|nr:hypothetical protein [Polyangiaceae bacterium]
FLPGLLFYLKPLSTLERTEGNWLLGIGLALAALLIGNTLIQLLQYWLALERLLKLILQHRLGRAFRRVAPFVRDSAAAQVSRSPHDLLRLCSCVTCLDDLVRQLEQLKEVTSRELCQQLVLRRREAIEVRDRALALASGSNAGDAAEREARLGRELVEASRALVEVLTPYWDGSRDAFLQRKTREPNASATRVTWQPGRSELPPAISVVTSGQEGGGEANPELPPELLWLRDAESLVATVTTLILGRHVRQFQYFVYTLTGCALLLVAAVSTYAFEPHRLLLTWIWAVVGATVALGLWVYLEIDRNGLLSRIAGTTPGKLTWDGALAVRIVTWVAFPLLSVAAVQYPELANQAFAFLEPFTRALH